MDERGGFESTRLTLPRQVPRGYLLKLFIDQRNHRVWSFFIALMNTLQELDDLHGRLS